MKRKGYILFDYYNRNITSYDHCSNFNDLMRKYDSTIDDIWDMEKRNKVHFFYLDIKKGKYFPLLKWKKNYVPNETTSLEKIISSKTF